jgi:hypothetical protein
MGIFGYPLGIRLGMESRTIGYILGIFAYPFTFPVHFEIRIYHIEIPL